MLGHPETAHQMRVHKIISRHIKSMHLHRLVITALIFLFTSVTLPRLPLAGSTTNENSGLLSIPEIIKGDVVSAWAAWPVTAASPGEKLVLAVVLDIDPGYHITADAAQIIPTPEFKPYPTTVTVPNLPDGLVIEPPIYPPAHAAAVEFTSKPLMVFNQRAIVYLPATVSAQTLLEEIRLTVVVNYQACDVRVCLLPREIEVPVILPLYPSGEGAKSVNQNLFIDYHTSTTTGPIEETVGFSVFGLNFTISAAGAWGLTLLLITAGLGGILLNFTPCVLPMIPIKIISLSNACSNRTRCFALGSFMSLGVLFFWLALGTAISAVSEFTATNQLFQYPAFTITVGLVIAFMAVGMCSPFSLRLPNFVYRMNPEQNTLPGSFGIGILTAILSTPCTAPFMGAAAAWATSQHPLTTLAVFAAIGIGMAIPYLILSGLPELVGKIPHTGPTSEIIKQVMGIFMFAAAAYFIGSGISALRMTPLAAPGKNYWWIVTGFVASGGLWLAYRTMRVVSGRMARTFFAVVGILIAVGSIYGGARLTDTGPIDWVYYTPESFQEALDENRIVVLIFTAEWCLNCKALEQSVLHSDSIARLLAEEDIVPIKVDITGRNESGRAKLQELGQLTIPLMVIFSSSGRELLKSDYYTAEQIIETINQARGN